MDELRIQNILRAQDAFKIDIITKVFSKFSIFSYKIYVKKQNKFFKKADDESKKHKKKCVSIYKYEFVRSHTKVFSFKIMLRNKTSVFRIYAKCPWGCFAIFRFMKFPPLFLYLESLPTCYNSMFNFHWGRINYQCTYQECKNLHFSSFSMFS